VVVDSRADKQNGTTRERSGGGGGIEVGGGLVWFERGTKPRKNLSIGTELRGGRRGDETATARHVCFNCKAKEHVASARPGGVWSHRRRANGGRCEQWMRLSKRV